MSQPLGRRAGVANLSLPEKVALGSGASFWTTQAMPDADIASIMLTDGPHGLRTQGEAGDHLGLNASNTATCFPTASALASSWDVHLAGEVGRAIGREAVDQDVHVVLGPGVNMKRNPLCGRNFEYFSEDPYLSGTLAASWIRGVQATGTGTSLKHFALNNQELLRMSTDVRVDERALHEYYLPAFEIAVKEGEPTTVMCAYNRVEGVYCSDNDRLLTTILRTQWGFDGAIVTDWGAMNDRVAAYAAGVDLEMPGNGGATDAQVRDAIVSGALDEDVVTRSAERVATLVARTTSRAVESPAGLYALHHELARRAAAESGVLLKNDGQLLPLTAAQGVAVLGALAQTPRFQGSGSSKVNPTQVISLCEGIAARTAADFAPGYRLTDDHDPDLLREAVALAERSQTVVVCVGLTDIFESEGFDRDHMRIPANQIALLDALAHLSERVVIVVVGGSAVEMPWEANAAAILHMQLAGQAGGTATADLLFGDQNPSGKLAETYPTSYEDVVNADRFGFEEYQTPYLESMFCGYRYFDTANVPVRYPFGHGLSYTTFDYSDLDVTSRGGHDLDITLTITNAGERDGAEVVQLYVAPGTGGAYRPEQELKAFTKVAIPAGQRERVTLHLDRRSFAVYDPAVEDWTVEAGAYDLRIGASSRDIRLKSRVELSGTTPRRSLVSDWYYTLKGKPTLADFLTIHEPFSPVTAPHKGTFDENSSLQEMKNSGLVCRIVYAAIERTVAKRLGGAVDYNDAQFKMMMYTAAGLPMRAVVTMSDGAMPAAVAQFVIDSANGHTLRGLWRLLRRR